MTRRKLLVRFLQAFGAGVAGVIGIPALLHVMSPVVRRDDDALWRAVGSIADFPPGEVRRAYVEVPRLHLHAVLSYPDGSCVGGHLIEAHVDPTLEVIVDVTAATVVREIDARTGLQLIAPPG